MPLPIWYLSFKECHGREPEKDELTLDQKSSLFTCCMKNRSAAIRSSENKRESYEVLKSLERDPALWHKLRADLDLVDRQRLEINDNELGELSEPLRSEIPEGHSKSFMRMMLEHGTDQLLQKIKDHVDEYYASNEKEHWDRILREVVGIEGDLDQLSIIFESMGGDQR